METAEEAAPSITGQDPERAPLAGSQPKTSAKLDELRAGVMEQKPEQKPQPEPEPQPQPEPQPLRQDDAGGEEEATRFQDFDDQRCVSPAASAPRLPEAR